MKSAKSILVATDFSPPANLAAERAAYLAQEWHCPLNLLHVLAPLDWKRAKHFLPDILRQRDPTATIENYLEKLQHDLERRYELTRVSRSVVAGRASSTIAQQAKEIGASLVVIGIRGEGIVHELALGGTAIRVLRRSPCPVLVVRERHVQAYRRVAIGTDFSEPATRALLSALSLFPEAEKLVIHACRGEYEGRMRLAGADDEEIERYRASELDLARQKMKASLAQAANERPGGLAPVIRYGYPATVVIDEMHREPVDLLVVGRHGQSVSDEQLLGSITLNLLHHVPCDVLLVP